ncbi:superoxide dismutase family protein [Sphingomonas mesophila]|uniref:superoxide dismutase family protein n=1 Tax=Sphingomonas mesophila TaxID=2303576 RepID=UPI000E586385|nr:superoxide dismutase family protein [Sphingomonas mesophila]
MRRSALIAAAVPALALAACADNEPVTENAANLTVNEAVLDNAAAVGNDAVPAAAPIAFTGGDGTALGNLTLEESPAGLMIRLAGSAMPPGARGIHLHMVGKCEGPKFESAGAHWNPDGKQHGRENPAGPHKGDLPNVTVGPDGALGETLTLAGVTLAELGDSDGTALVVHAAPDDNKTDPSGNSGDRIACAVLAPAG